MITYLMNSILIKINVIHDLPNFNVKIAEIRSIIVVFSYDLEYFFIEGLTFAYNLMLKENKIKLQYKHIWISGMYWPIEVFSEVFNFLYTITNKYTNKLPELTDSNDVHLFNIHKRYNESMFYEAYDYHEKQNITLYVTKNNIEFNYSNIFPFPLETRDEIIVRLKAHYGTKYGRSKVKIIDGVAIIDNSDEFSTEDLIYIKRYIGEYLTDDCIINYNTINDILKMIQRKRRNILGNIQCRYVDEPEEVKGYYADFSDVIFYKRIAKMNT